jgi:hypothetical protein
VLVTAIAGVLVSIAGARAAESCSCAGTFSGNPPCEATWQGGPVFVGKVISIDDVERPPYGPAPAVKERRVRMTVSESFTTPVAPQTDVFTGMNDAECGYGFSVGSEYLVYSYVRRSDGVVSTGICSRTRAIGDASDDLRYLRGLATDRSTEGRIIGMVLHAEPSRGGTPPSRAPASGLRITVRTGGRSRSGVTDANGRYEIRVPPGMYQPVVETDRRFEARPVWNRTVQLDDRRGCVVADFYVRQVQQNR